MPSALASLLRATAQPSLLLSTMTGRPSKSGRNTRSHETKKLLQSARANIPSGFLDDIGHDAPYDEIVVGAYGNGLETGAVLVAGHQHGAAFADFHALDGIFAVDEADGLAAVVRVHGPVDDEDVAFVHVGINHRHAVHQEKERGGSVPHQQFYKVELFAHVLCRRIHWQ